MNTRIYDAIRIVVSNKMVTALLVSSRGWNFVVRMKFFDDTRISLLCQSTRITEPIPRVTVNYRYPRKIDNSVTENATTSPPPFFFILFWVLKIEVEYWYNFFFLSFLIYNTIIKTNFLKWLSWITSHLLNWYLYFF